MTLQQTLATHWHALFHCPFHQTVAATLAVALTTTYLLRPSTIPPRSIPSPRTAPPTDPSHPYPPDLLPGSRYVSTPYGTIHVNEFGPEDGKKILLIHGISTPSAVFFKLATTLADNGFRVMTFDLFGRGYSDAPLGVAYDERLFVSECLYVLNSSPLHWDRYSVLGYSLGGGIAVSFAEHMHRHIETLLVVAPAGILRSNKADMLLRLSMNGYIPRAIESWVANRRAQRMPPQYVNRAWAEGEVDIPGVMKWQVGNHKGYVHAFVSSFRDGPIYGRDQEWRRVGGLGLKTGVLMAEGDEVIDLELLDDMKELLGGEKCTAGVMKNAGHDLVNARGKEVAEFAMEVINAE